MMSLQARSRFPCRVYDQIANDGFGHRNSLNPLDVGDVAPKVTLKPTSIHHVRINDTRRNVCTNIL